MSVTVDMVRSGVGLERVLATIEAHGDELASADRLPDAVHRGCLDAGLYRLCLAGELGGSRIPMPDTMSIIEELSYADGSVGWCVTVGNVSASLLAGIDEAHAREIAARPEQLSVAGGFPAVGRAQPSDGGYRLTGHWSFASGATSATWLLGGALVAPAGPPLVAFFPADRARVVPNWDVSGLRATGSHDVVAEDVTVPAGRTTPLVGGPRWSADPIAAVPFFALGALLGAVPVGIAQRALDELLELAATKVRFGQATPVLQDQRFQDGFSAVQVRLAAARSHLYDRAGEVWRGACEGAVQPEAQAGATLAMGLAADAALAAARFAHEAAGTESIRTGSVLARCLNDVTVATRHVAFSPFARGNAARVLLGLPPVQP